MKQVQEAVGFLAIVALIAGGAWYVSVPDAESRSVPLVAGGSPSGRSASPICCNLVDWSQNGQTLLIRHRGEIGAESRLVLCPLLPGEARIPIDSQGDSTNAARFAPDGRHVLMGSHNGRLWWFDPLEDGTARQILKLDGALSFTAVAVAQDGRQVAGGTSDGTIHVYDLLRERDVTLSAGENSSAVSSVRFSRDGARVLAARHDGRLKVWDVATGELLKELPGHQGMSKGAEFLADGRRIISVGLDDSVRIWEIDSGRETWRGEFGLMGINALAVSHDGRLAAWGGHDRRIIVWSLELGQRKLQIEKTAPTTYSLSFSPDGTKLASAGDESSIRVYDTATGKETHRIAVGSLQD